MIPTSSKGVRALAAGLLTTLAVVAAALPPGTDEEIRQRIAPFGGVAVPEVDESAEPAERVALGPQEVYGTYCQACHMAGVSGAPKLGDTDAWAPRIAKGTDTLYDHTLNGFNVMPPRGTCMDCTDEELLATVDYMIEESQ